MPTPSQIRERNDLLRCLNEHRDAGHFRWLPDAVTLEPTGTEFVQYELNKLYQQYGTELFPCLLSHDPARPRNAHAMQVRTVEYVIGYVPDYAGAWWQHQFDLLDDPQGRLVGLCRIEREVLGNLIRFKPVCQFRVRFGAPVAVSM